MATKSISFRTKCLHLDSGEIRPAVVICTPDKPLEISLDLRSANFDLPARYHIALARACPHVHARESVVPSREEFEAQKIHEGDFETVHTNILTHNKAYDAYRAGLAGLRGGYWTIACMGNTPWGPIGVQRWEETLRLYQNHSVVPIHVWPRLEPGVAAVPGQEGKHFGSTFGGSGLSDEAEDAMFSLYRGHDVSYHNDQARAAETIAEFKGRVNPPMEQLHHLYFNEDTVIASQKKIIDLARKNGLRSLRARHIPTGSAFQMILDERSKGELKLPAEIGLDYMYHNRDMVLTQIAGMINYRRPAFPSPEEQRHLIELTKKYAHDPTVCWGSDHAPHTLEAKAFKNGLPGSPGTRNLEHAHQIHMHLVHNQGFSHRQIDLLAAVNPVRYMEQYWSYKFPYPVATMKTGAMCNLVVFDPDCPYEVDEAKQQHELQDPHYHSAMVGEKLRGLVAFTVVNGKVWQVNGGIKSLN